MPSVINISPVTRVEGHLDVEVTVETVNGRQEVIDARATAPMFRGFERILVGRDPRDAVHYTQRVCGVCPIAHAMASSLALENAFGITPTENGRIMRNLVLGANFIQSHILHFYHLAAPDYINTTGILDMSPWKPRFTVPDMVTGSVASTLVGHYVQALEMRRKAHQMGAIFAGRMPTTASFVPGGTSEAVTATAVSDFRALLTELRAFINNVYIPDGSAVMAAFPEYMELGRGCGNLLAYGVFDLNAAGTSKLLKRGRHTNGADGTVDATQIKEYVAHSWFAASSGNLNPAVGVTEPSADKDAGYSWIKAPRYQDTVHEVGPLARMWVNNDYRVGISVMDRILARALEARKVADAMDGWLNQLAPGGAVYKSSMTPTTAVGIGLTEAARGALGHWVGIGAQKISRYQMVTPTGWNASPRDDMEQMGAIEQALLGTPVADAAQPVEVLRVIHSFDPCLACSVHLVHPGPQARRLTTVQAGLTTATN
jgi:hydrogenase large subunit